MEKIEVAVRLRPLNCNPAEQKHLLDHSTMSPFIDEQHQVDYSTCFMESMMQIRPENSQPSNVWRIENDSKTLRLIPTLTNQQVEGSLIAPRNHSHNKSFGATNSGGTLSRQTSVGKLSRTGTAMQPLPRPHHPHREDNKSIGVMRPPFQTRPQTPMGKWDNQVMSTPGNKNNQESSNLKNQIKLMKASQTFNFGKFTSFTQALLQINVSVMKARTKAFTAHSFGK